MKTIISIIFIFIFSCEGNFKERKTYLLTNNTAKIWYIDIRNKNSNNWITLWYFNNNNDYYRFLYNSKTKELKVLDNGDKIDNNSFSFVGNDSISLNDSSFPILKLSRDELILKNIYSYSFFPEDSIILRTCRNKNVVRDCDEILKEMTLLTNKINL